MLQELVSFWPGGPQLSFGNYLVWHRYIFAGLFVLWVWWLSRSPRSLAAVLGLAGLFVASATWLHQPLGRTYGLVPGSESLHELAQAMVIATGGLGGGGIWVASPQPYPLWSSLLALTSGLNPTRLLKSYDLWLWFMPVVAAIGVYWASTRLPHESSEMPKGSRGVAAVFFVLLLSTPRLGFLHDGGVFQPHLFWTRPVLAFGWVLMWCWFIGVTSRSLSWFWGITMAVAVALVSPTLLVIMMVAASLFALDAFRRSGTDEHGLRRQAIGSIASLLVATASIWVFGLPLVVFEAPSIVAVDTLLALTLDYGLWFYLSAAAVWLSLRTDAYPYERWFAYLAISGWAISVLGALWPPLFRVLEWDWCLSSARLGVALLASQGFFRLVVALHGFHQARARNGETLDWAKKLFQRLSLSSAWALALGVTLPWCFPFWFLPHQMDPLYRDSVVPISRQMLAAMDSIRDETPPDATFVTGPGYSAWIPVLTGRRVLRTHGPPNPPRDSSRQREEVLFFSDLAGRRVGSGESEFPIDHVASGRLDEEAGVAFPWKRYGEDERFEEVFRQQRFMRVLRIKP